MHNYTDYRWVNRGNGLGNQGFHARLDAGGTHHPGLAFLRQPPACRAPGEAAP